MSWVSSDLHANSYSLQSTRLSSLRERLRYSGAIHSSRSALSRGDSANDEVIIDVGLNQQATYIEHLLARMEQHGLRRCCAKDEDLSSYTVAHFAERDDDETNNNNNNDSNNDNNDGLSSAQLNREPYYYICVPCEMRLTRVAQCAASLRMLDDVHYHFASAAHRQNARWMADSDIDRTLHTSSMLSAPSNAWTRIYVNGHAVLLSRRPGGGEMFYPLPHEEHRVERPEEPSTLIATQRVTFPSNISLTDCTMNNDKNKYVKSLNSERKQQTRRDKRQRWESSNELEEKYAVNSEVTTMEANMAAAHLPLLYPAQPSRTYWFAPLYNFFTQCRQLIVPCNVHDRGARGPIISQKRNYIYSSQALSYSPCHGEYTVQHIPLTTYVQNTKLPASHVPLYPVLLRLQRCKVRKSDMCSEQSTWKKHTEEQKESEAKHVYTNENLQHKLWDANLDDCEIDVEDTKDSNNSNSNNSSNSHNKNDADDNNAWCSVYVQRSNSPLLQWTTADEIEKSKTYNVNRDTNKWAKEEENLKEKEYLRLERCEVEHDGVYRLCLFSNVELQKMAVWQQEIYESQTSQMNSIDSKIYKIESHAEFAKTNVTSTTATQLIRESNFVQCTGINETVQANVLTKELLDTIPLYLPYQAYHAVNSTGSSYLNSINNNNSSSNISDNSEEDKSLQNSNMEDNLASNHVSNAQSVRDHYSMNNKNGDDKASNTNSRSYSSSSSSSYMSSERQ